MLLLVQITLVQLVLFEKRTVLAFIATGTDAGLGPSPASVQHMLRCDLCLILGTNTASVECRLFNADHVHKIAGPASMQNTPKNLYRASKEAACDAWLGLTCSHGVWRA